METKLKSVLELTNLEAEQELTELRGGCWHSRDFENHSGDADSGCFICKCGKEFEDSYENPAYATSYDAIIPVIQKLDYEEYKNFERLVLFIPLSRTPRELTNAVIEVLRSK